MAPAPALTVEKQKLATVPAGCKGVIHCLMGGTDGSHKDFRDSTPLEKQLLGPAASKRQAQKGRTSALVQRKMSGG